MRIRIHHGAHEVGGNCVEVEAGDGTRIALDLGRPLTAASGDIIAAPNFDGPLLAVLISHPHLDHYGLVDALEPAPLVFVGEEAARVLGAAAFFSPMTQPLKPDGFLRDRATFSIGPFVITPYLADHSAFDSYSLLIEVDGKRLFYTGDFRGHGRKAQVFEELVAEPPQSIDVLVIEGTHVGVSNERDDDDAATESALEDELAAICRATDGSVAVFGSAQNVDRLVTVFRAARRSGRTFVTDLYSATVAAATRPTIPQPGFEGYRVYVPQRQRVLVKQSGEFSRVEAIRDIRVFGDELACGHQRYLMYLPSSAAHEMVTASILDAESRAFWSMWDGYLHEPSGKRLRAELAAAGVPLSSLHTSGHATIGDLERLIEALAPNVVVPIHTNGGARFADLFPGVVAHPDGAWWAA